MSKPPPGPYPNPYSPTSAVATGQPSYQYGIPGRNDPYVRQVRIVAILMIVQASMELLYGLLLFGIVIMFAVMMNDPQFQQGMQQNPGPGMELFLYIYGGLGGVMFFVGSIRLVAGIMNFNFRGRTFGIIANFAGLLTVCGFYCLPTAIGLTVYGCIIYFQRSVLEAFEMRSMGSSVDEVLQRFG
jgi:hypothetical protein